MGFFKAYDMRGTFGRDFDLALVRKIGAALPGVLGARRFLVGRDARSTGPAVAAALSRGLASAGASVADIGLCSTPNNNTYNYSYNNTYYYSNNNTNNNTYNNTYNYTYNNSNNYSNNNTNYHTNHYTNNNTYNYTNYNSNNYTYNNSNNNTNNNYYYNT